MQICVVALGKIGLPLAVQYASLGHRVVGVDISPRVVDLVNAGEEPFPGEAGLAEGLKQAVADGLLTATLDAPAAVAAAGTDPHARLNAYVTASFAPPIADRALLATWVAFWTLTTKPQIAERHDAIYTQYREELEGLLADCGIAPADRRLTAIAITALVDGLWLELCLSPDSFTADEARSLAERQLASYFERSATSER